MFKLFRLKGEDGFTIAELLIVIVVLGILAAIAIPSYTGLQKRARIAELESAGRAIMLGLEMYKAFDDDGKYPDAATAVAVATLETDLVEYIDNYNNVVANLAAESEYQSSDTGYELTLVHAKDGSAEISVKDGVITVK